MDDNFTRVGHVRIVSDPIPVENGGFRPGAGFTGEQIYYMVRYGTLTDGAVIERKDGTREVVKCGRLVRVKA